MHASDQILKARDAILKPKLHTGFLNDIENRFH